MRALPCILLVMASIALGVRLGMALPERLELPTLVIAVLAVAAYYIARETRAWNYFLLSVLATVLGTYGTLSGILTPDPRSWAIMIFGLALATLVGLVLRPHRGVRVVFSLAVAYVLAWFLAAAVIRAAVLLRPLAAVGWFLFVSVGSFVIARAATDGPSVEISGLMGDLLIVSANLMLTGVTAIGL